jgi:hypothetical protein
VISPLAAVPGNGYIVDPRSAGLIVTWMIFPQLARFNDVALLVLRLMVAIVFLTSDYKHLNDPETRRQRH